ncbi:hypothetical protein ACIQU4_13585 [Streptomyces sp. NPDC090741]|uniref:hypothetical protein n=1 Tax=Streptomyces sp. NPDC090741 TaxID=3365967 RepID=UPI00380ED8B2
MALTRPLGSPWWAVPWTAVIALLVCGVGAFLQERTGFTAYEPPRLERDRYVGQRIGDGGARKLRLSENGEVVAGTAERPEPFCGIGDPDDLHPRYAVTLHRV